MNRISIIYIGILCAVLASCTDEAIVDKNVAISGLSWDYNTKPEVVVHITDNSRPYHLFLNLRHTAAYSYANVFVLLHESGPGVDTVSTQRIEVPLAAPDGRWLGKGSGSMFMHQQLVRENYRFPDTGRYVFSFEQNMRENPLRHIADVGIRIAPSP